MRNQAIQSRFSTSPGQSGNNLAGGCVLQPKVDSDFRAIAQVEIGTQNDVIAPQIVSEVAECIGSQTIGFGQGEIIFHPRDILARNGEQLLAGSQFAGKHFRKRG